MNRINDSLRVLLWSCVFIYVVFCSLQITQVDIWWQLAEGFHILQTFHLPTQPAAAFGLPASPYFDEYAGYEVVLSCLYKITGFPGLWMAFIAVYLAILFLPSLYSRQSNSRYDVFSCLALLTAGLLMKDRLEQRPELVGTLFQVWLMLLLRKWKLEEVTLRSSVPLFVIFLLWTNTHSSFLFGLFTLFLWAACEFVLKFRKIAPELLLKNGFLLAAVALVALCINPYGPWRLCFPFLQAFDPGSTALSFEMWPIMDPWSPTGILVLTTMALIAWAALISRTTQLWLILFSLFAAYMTHKSFRCVSLLAIALLFVYAARDAQIKPVMSRYPLLSLVRCALLSFACLFMLFGDAYTFDFSFNELSHEMYFASHSNMFAPEIVNSDALGSNQRRPVICEHGEGSYLTYEGNDNFRPILDSGMSHFSDASKRYFFLFLNEPEALDLVLNDLRANYLVLNKNTTHWILELGRSPGWRMSACSPNGMLWQRDPGGVFVPSATDLANIAASRDVLLQRGDLRSAFCYSTLLNQPVDSLALFSNYGYADWPEGLYVYFRSWVNTVPQAAIQDFLGHRDAGHNIVMDAILSERLGPEQYEAYRKKIAPNPEPQLWKFVHIDDCLARGDREEARRIFDTISTTQPSSVTYYRLWHEVRAGNQDAAQDKLGAYGQWQTWDDSARAFMESMSGQLNARIDIFQKSKN